MANSDNSNARLKYIGPKDLGNLILPTFCPRCFWYERHYGPFPARFPGIFTVLDGVSKKSVYRSFQTRKKLPDWLNLPSVKRRVLLDEIGAVQNFQNRKYLIALHKRSGWYLRGAPDSVFELENGTLHIVDFKTARFTSKQDELYPLYEVQLNGYLLLSSKYPVSKLSLVYCEPKQELKDDIKFNLEFEAKIIDVDLKPNIIPELLMKAREIVDLEKPPEAIPNCHGTCYYIDKIIDNEVKKKES
ncbi:MAG TPA: PD-(D/E)XK nuclease family protein [Candidatus Pacearchaeota archaeon]|mgnify:FL=1|nr:PD-(D/E)XK nuclease family protein [Candidatus Pacearchaeota archaeon]